MSASKSYGGQVALRQVDLSITAGEMVALIGPSGAGKSTLLRSINGLVTLDGPARVEIGGEPLQAGGRLCRQARRLRARIGFVFQQFNLVGRLDVATNVRLGALGRIAAWRGLPGLWPASVNAAAADALARMGIAEHAGRRADTLSGGQQQRTAIARALVQRADILLADEPVASLDPANGDKVMAAMSDLNRTNGVTVVASLHQVELARRWCGRVVALAGGAVAFDGRPSDLDDRRLAAIYGGEVLS